MSRFKKTFDWGDYHRRIPPFKRIDQEQFEKLCAMGCPRDEICAFFDVGKDTLIKWCKDVYDGKTFQEARDLFMVEMKVGIRRAQLKHMERDPGMAKYLGKIYLGQDEKQTISVETKNANPLADLSEEELRALIRQNEVSEDNG